MIWPVLLALAATTHSSGVATIPAQVIRGDWCAGSKNAFHEEFSLDAQEGVHVFRSWLHKRPALEGTWELHGRTLTIRGEHGDLMTYTIISASRVRLVIREHSRKDREVYVRIGKCLAFENPYEDPAFHDSNTPPN